MSLILWAGNFPESRRLVENCYQYEALKCSTHLDYSEFLSALVNFPSWFIGGITVALSFMLVLHRFLRCRTKK